MKVLDLTLSTPAENLAYDEALLDEAESGHSGEVLRFWEPLEPFVVVGYSNQVAAEVNVVACQTGGVPILRRCSGGGTVLQGPGCLNFAVILQITNAGATRNISTANQFIMERNRAAVQAAVGPSAGTIRIQGHTDLTSNGKKFSGNSQRRQRRYLLFHGTFLLAMQLGQIGQLLRMPTLQPEYRNYRTHQDFLTNLGVCAASLKRELQFIWLATERCEPLSPARIAALVAQKYSLPSWNLQR